MPRHLRVLPATIPLHLVQRAVDRKTLFHDPADFQRFLRILAAAQRRYPVRLLAYCVMPNHWHLLAESDQPDSISRYMQWAASTHAVRHRLSTGTVGHGHVYQGRFWSEPITGEAHFLNVMRYIEANPVRAGLARRASEWRWSSAWERQAGTDRQLLAAAPVDLPPGWSELVDASGSALQFPAAP